MTLINNRYEIIHTLARGGFGQTFLAVDTHLPSQPHCVIKQLKPLKEANGTTENELKMRFGKEAIVLEKLGANHPQIPSLYAYFTQNDEFYLVQEYIEGETLRQRVQRTGVLIEQEAENFLLGILPVLVYTHGHQIVHRDIKPDNIIIRDRDKLPVLIDFGVIKEVMASTMLNMNGEPQPSLPFGTPGYMASEQAAGRPMFNSDLYSLGLTVIFLLTGKDPHQLITDVHSGELVWQGEVPALSPAFGQIIQRAVAFHPRDRYDSAQTMLNAVEALAGSATNVPTMVAPPSRPLPSQSTIAMPSQPRSPQRSPNQTTGINKTLVATTPEPTFTTSNSSTSSSTLAFIILIPLMLLGGAAVGIIFF
ncbi:MAG: serine/threonine protein kinase [Synechococcaceae cyanobacterium RL_1_2]|nr:serine/threonine protein kinase [Synechococcaceae cyanobacterium RL_1_2]